MPLPRTARRPRLEPLEARELLAAFVVTDSGDLDNGHTLRSAILGSDATAGPNVIDFLLPTGDPGVIVLTSALPTITSPVLVDGSSQAGLSIAVDAGRSGATGLVIDAAGVTIKGLTVRDMTSYGIEVEGPGSDLIETGYVLGTIAPTGPGLPQEPVPAAIWIDGSPNNTIGGGGLAENIAGNAGVGVLIVGEAATHNFVVGSTIGSADGGVTADPNTMGGIEISGAPANSVGAPGNSGANLISGNGGDGILVTGIGANNNLIRSNNIGLNTPFSAAMPTASAGIEVDNVSGTTIGGPVGSQNLISGNGGDGILISNARPAAPGTYSADISGNVIGTDGTHTRAIGNRDGIDLAGDSGVLVSNNYVSGNRRDGVEAAGGSASTLTGNKIGLDGANTGPLPNGTSAIPGTTYAGLYLSAEVGDEVGGPSPSDRNVISGNAGPGVIVAFGSNERFRSNIIGLDPAGARRVPNLADGIVIESGAVGTVIGGDPSPGAGNVISSNYGSGVHVLGSTVSGTVISWNRIGTDPTGAVPLGNALDGIRLDQAGATIVNNLVTADGNNGITLDGGSGSLLTGNTIGAVAGGAGNLGIGLQLIGSTGNTIGGTLGAATNIIASNSNVGIYVSAGSSKNLIAGNFIGLDGSGMGGRGNADGIVVRDSAGTTIGGRTAGAGNIVGSNANFGIDISGASSTGTSVIGNVVGLGANGSDPAGNGADGLFVDGAPGVLIVRNILSGNGGAGLQALGATATGATVQANLIGLDGSGTLPRSNGRGVIFNQAPGNTVGGATDAGRNLIAANRAEGILILGLAASGNLVASNWIGLDATGLRPEGNGGDGVLIDAPRNVVGATGGGGRNVIAASGSVGIHLLSASATGNLVAGNWVGLDAGGLQAPGSARIGILLDGAPGNTIGGATVAGSGNFVTGSGVVDVAIAGAGASGNLVAGNLIGTDSTGSALGSAPIGFLIVGAAGNTLGGATATAVNIIGGHASVGVEIADAGASANLVIGNQIGSGPSGSATLANGLGALISDAPGNTIGGVGSDPPNVIVGNRSNAIAVVGQGAVGNVVGPNVIGPDA